MPQLASDGLGEPQVTYRKTTKNCAQLDYVSSIGLAGIVCSLTFIVAQYYVSGDPVVYRQYYSAVSTLGLDEGYRYYLSTTGGTEPIYFLLTWMVSRFCEKDLFDAILNGILVVLGLRYLNKGRVHWILIPALLMNFYILVLFFSADRLKLGFIIYLWGVVLGGRSGFVLSATSVFAHLQMAVPVALYGIFKISHLPPRRALFSLSAGVAVILATLVFLPVEVSESIKGKFDFYNSNANALVSSAKAMVFAILILIYNYRQPGSSLVFSIIFVLLSILLGSDRVIMIAYFAFLHFALRVNNGLNAGVIVTSFYFTAKAGLFIYSVLTVGTAFPDVEFLN
jgi:hypothetical protein